MDRTSGLRLEYSSLGPEGLAVVLKTVHDATTLSATASPAQVLARYSRLFEQAFAELSVVVGAKGAQAITQRGIKKASARIPALRAATATEERVALDGMRDAPPAELRGDLEHLFVTTMDVLASLIGVDLLSTLLARIGSGEAVGGGR